MHAAQISKDVDITMTVLISSAVYEAVQYWIANAKKTVCSTVPVLMVWRMMTKLLLNPRVL
jgi:hypothetical protein